MMIQHRFVKSDESKNGEIRKLYRVYCPNCKRSSGITEELAVKLFGRNVTDLGHA